MLTPCRPLKVPIRLLDAVNPVVVLASILGLLLEFTPLKPWVKNFNVATDLFFVLDFLVRFLAFPKKSYLLKHYGWIDLLAAIPGLLFFIDQVPSLLAVFKFLRIGRFFKIIRLLRFLKVFSFLRRMKDDSAWVQDRIMKVGIVIVLVGVVAIGVVGEIVEGHFAHEAKEKILAYEKAAGTFPAALEMLPASELVAWRSGDERVEGTARISAERWLRLEANEDHSVVSLGDGKVVLLHDPEFRQYQNNVLLAIMVSLILTLVILLFYMGSVFAKDVSRVTLVTDSVEADDFTLLLEEGRALSPTGDFDPEPGESELVTLVKAMNRMVIRKKLDVSEFDEDVGSGGAGGFGTFGGGLEMPSEDPLPSDASNPASPGAPSEEIRHAVEAALAEFRVAFREELASDLEERMRSGSVEAVKLSARSIVDYLKKNGFGG